jgi:glycogen debranching enzyme
VTQPRQPFLHDLTIQVAAPSQAFSTEDGRMGRADGPVGVHGLWHADVRVLSGLALTVDGEPPEHIATRSIPADEAGDGLVLTFLCRQLADGRSADPSNPVRVDIERRLAPGRLTETITVTSWLDQPITVRPAVALARDLAPISVIRVGERSSPPPGIGTDGLRWGDDEITATLTAAGANVGSAAETVELSWTVDLPARGAAAVGWTLAVEDRGSVVGPANHRPLDAVGRAAELAGRATSSRWARDSRLQPWLERSLADLNGLRMTTLDDPDDVFFAAGSPWFLTLFGRDSLWTARMLLPVDPGYAMGTLRVLARRAGTKVDIDTAEAPGKILHEVRRAAVAMGSMTLPPVYYGTIDATPLWVCTLHDAWRAGVPDAEVEALLPTLEGALRWVVEDGDADGDGFLEYLDDSGHGLANQGWKDSADAVRFADGTIATGPVALCEVQAYAYEAARHGADLLDAFGRPDAEHYREWAAALRERFRAAYWCGKGEDRFPALALDGEKRPVDTLTSNIGHLLGTGLLDPDEELAVARHLAGPDLDSGLGLRTMSAAAGGYSPLSYHCGSVWPHDTAIVISGLHRAGLGEYAEGLIEGLLRASVAFQQRLPELWSGEGEPVPYPTACQPQAWSAAAAVVVASVLADR